MKKKRRESIISFSCIQCAEKGIAVICHLQKPPIIFLEKPVPNMDNLWVTIDGYHPPQTQSDWEETCFLDQSYHGYYSWPKILQYPMNKQERYHSKNMPEDVMILYERFSDRSFLQQMIELMLVDESEDEDLEFSEIRFAMYKVRRT